MPSRSATALGAPCWIDLSTSDAGRARSFYGAVLGWQATEGDPRFGGYFNFVSQGALVAGCNTNQPGGPRPDCWMVYMASADAAASVATASAAGGVVVVPAMEVAELGTMAVLADPGGVNVGVWQPGTHAGFGRADEPGAPAWFELHSAAYPEALAFYPDVFGWATTTVSDTPEFRYSIGAVAGEEVVGLTDAAGTLAAGHPGSWFVYLGVADADLAVATVVDLGGTVTGPAQDSPHGRFAAVTDPMGAAFTVIAGP